MKWIESNKELPTKDGFYYCVDSVGDKTLVHFFNRHWFSPTGHPVEKWLDESDQPNSVQEGDGVKFIEWALSEKCDYRYEGDGWWTDKSYQYGHGHDITTNQLNHLFNEQNK